VNQLTRSEAAVTTGSATAVVTVLIALLVSFGLPLTNDQQVAILSTVGVLAPLVATIITRRLVWSQKSVEEKIAATARAAAGVAPNAPTD
jgi:hypothetical protein